LEKNGVVGVPRLKGKAGKGKMPQRSASGTTSEEKGEADWLWGKEWGWEDDKSEDVREVLVVRDSESFDPFQLLDSLLRCSNRSQISLFP